METITIFMILAGAAISAFAYQYIINIQRRNDYQKDKKTLNAIYAIFENITSAGRVSPFDMLYHANVYQQAVAVQSEMSKLKNRNEQLEKENIRLKQIEAQIIPLESVEDYHRKITSLSLQLEDLLHANFDEITIKPYVKYGDKYQIRVDRRGYHLHMVIDGKEVITKE
jgi:transcriptional/translational regulatory protein YebC/TACO1